MQTYNFRGLLGIMGMDIIPNARKRELCGVAKGVNERIYESVLRWFGHIEKMDNDRIAKRVCLGVVVRSTAEEVN